MVEFLELDQLGDRYDGAAGLGSPLSGLGGERTRRLSSVLSETFSGMDGDDRSSDGNDNVYDAAFTHGKEGENDMVVTDISASMDVGGDEEESGWRARGLSDCILDDDEGTNGRRAEYEEEVETNAVEERERRPTHFSTAEALDHLSERPNLETDSEVSRLIPSSGPSPATHPHLLLPSATTAT